MIKEPSGAEDDAGRALWEAWRHSGRQIATGWYFMDKFDRLRWIETAKTVNAAEREACAKVSEAHSGVSGWPVIIANAIRARGQA